MERDWANTASKVVSEDPEPHMNRLCDMAANQQWDPADMDWSKVNFSGIPQEVKQLLAHIFAQIHYGEVIALAGASYLAKHGPTPSIRKFASFQAADEARHVKWFASLIGKLDCRAPILPSVITLMKGINRSDTLEDKTLGMHLLVESMAHTIFVECSKAVSEMPLFHRTLSPLRKLKPVFSDWLPNYILKDEALHLDFGVSFLRCRVAEMNFEQRDKLELQVDRWAQLFLDVADDPSLVGLPGMSSQAIGTQCILDINQHLFEIGIEARVPELHSITASGSTIDSSVSKALYS